MKVVWYNIKVLKVLYFIQFEDRDEDYVALNWNKQWSKSFLVMFLTFTWFWKVIEIRVALPSTKGND